MSAEDIEEVYRRVLSETAIPFAPVTEAADWHLRVFFLPSFLPETVFDVDHRGGLTRFYRCRFQQSVWTALFRAKEKAGQVQPLTSERAAAELPPGHPLVQMVADEHVFRMADQELVTLDGDLYGVQLTYFGGVAEFEADANRLSPGWHRILDAVGEAAKALPQSSK